MSNRYEIQRPDDYGFLVVGKARKVVKEDSKADAVIHFFTNVTWILFKNKNYEKDMSMDFPNEYYNHPSMVPIYRIVKPSVGKIGYIIPRKNEGSNYLLVTTEQINSRTLKKVKSKFYIRLGFKKDYSFSNIPADVLRKVG